MELTFPKLKKVKHGEQFEIDSRRFYHNKYRSTRYIAKDGTETKAVQPNAKQRIDLLCSTNVVFKTEDKEKTMHAVSNTIAMDLAAHLIAIKDKSGTAIYHIDEGPALNFEGRIIINRNDGQAIEVLTKDNASLLVKILD